MSKNLHLTHIEDLVIDGGVKGTRMAIQSLIGVRDVLQGHAKSPMTVQGKVDGAPAIIVGHDPADGKFFVATKGAFNKNPVLYKSIADIEDRLSGDLAEKMKQAFVHLSKLKIPGVFQGDLLFDSGSKKVEKIDGQTMITFHPNTIVYAAPFSSPLGKAIRRAKLGVAWHTTYQGRTMAEMKASYNKPIARRISGSADVWSIDTTFQDVSGAATFTARETERLSAILSEAGRLFRNTSASALNGLSADEDFRIRVNTFINSKVRSNQPIGNIGQFVTDLMNYIHQHYQKLVDEKKTERGKETARAKQRAALAYFSQHDKSEIVSVFKIYELLIEAKLMIIKKLKTLSSLETFLQTKEGFRVTSPEGFVAIDTQGNAVKLVDRLEFSAANFSQDVIRGWQK